jgi:hypothetical protein
MKLRPLGYLPLWEAGKVYMKREVEPLYEEEILARMEAR